MPESRPMGRSRCAAVSDDRLCICGHSPHWHSPDGVCEHDGECGCRQFLTAPPPASEPDTVIVRLTREELEAVIIGTEASRLKPLLRPARWEAAASAERKLFAALRERGWNR